ncbi:MAG: hypothetical protein ACI855_003189, partial [Myxococcota bacterium]
RRWQLTELNSVHQVDEFLDGVDGRKWVVVEVCTGRTDGAFDRRGFRHIQASGVAKFPMPSPIIHTGDLLAVDHRVERIRNRILPLG